MIKNQASERLLSVKEKLQIEQDSRYYESLKTALYHDQRYAIMLGMSMNALKKIAQSEHIPVKGIRGKKDIINTLLKVIEGRYKTIDKGEHVYIPDVFGLPMCGDNTPLNAARIEFNKKAIAHIQHKVNDALNDDAITVEAVDVTDKRVQPETTEVKALPATASQQEDKNDCHKFCVGDFFTFLDEYYTVIKRTPCYVFLRDKNYRTIRASLGIYNRDFNDGTIKGDEFITFEVSKHEYKIDAKDKEEKPAELIRQEQKLKPEPIKKRSPEEAQNLPKYVYEITPKGHYVIMDNEVLSKGLSNRREWQIPHLAPFKYGDVIHPENYEISIKISNIALQLENAKDEKTVREILKKYDKSFIRDIACNAYHFAFDEYERHSVFSFKTTKKDLLALLIKAVLKVNEAMRDAQSKSQPAQENKPASQTKKHTRKSKQEIIPFQLGMFYIANIDGRNFNARVTAFIEHFSNFSKADKNGKIKNKIVRTKDVCFDVLYNGEIKHVQAGISIDKDSGCEYITTVIYPPIKISADNPVECATPHTASDITPVYKFKPDERYPLTLREYYGNIKCVSFCNSSQVTFEFGAYNSEALHEQNLLTVPVFVDPETKSQFFSLPTGSCYARDVISQTEAKESHEDINVDLPDENHESHQADLAHTFSKCPHCESTHKPYVKLCKTKTAMRAKMKTGSGVAEICDYLRVRCRDCGYEEHTIIHSSGNGKVINRSRDEATVIAIEKWNNPIKDNAVVLSPVKALSENAPEQTRIPRKRFSVTLEDIRSCENEKQIIAMLINLSVNSLRTIAVELLEIPQAHFRGMNKKNVLASFIACRVILMRKILAQNNSHQQEQAVKPEKTVSREQEAQSESCADNFYMTMNEKTGQFSFVFE